MNFEFRLLNTLDGAGQRIAGTDDPAVAAKVHAEIVRICGAPPVNVTAIREADRLRAEFRGPINGRPVIIIGLSPEREEDGHLKVGDEFQTARELNAVLGYSWPAVTQALSKANVLPLDEGAELRGVKFQFKDLWEKHLLSQTHD